MRVAIYIRVSTLDQAREGYSLAAQERTLRDWCEKHGHEVYKLYEDAGKSAKDIKHRPAMKALLEDAKLRKYDLVLFWALSRFTRSIIDLYQSIDLLQKYDISIKSMTEPFDTRSAFGRFIVGILGLIAQLERELTGERVQEGMLERARQGKRTTNEVLGYDIVGKDELAVNDIEAETVLYIYDRYIEYRNLSAVAELCSLKQYRGKRGRIFHPENIKKILTRPIYCGYNTYLGQTFLGDHEPIVSIKKFNKVQEILKKPKLRAENIKNAS